MDLAAFERNRLALFRRYGFEGESAWFVDRRNRRSYLIRRGRSAHPTVLVHGGLSEASEWSLLAGRLRGDVVIPDRPGCGLSYAIDYRNVDYQDAAAEWLLDLADGIGAAAIDLVGNSMGGYFAMAFAAAHPKRVRRLVLVGAPAGLDRKLPLFIRLLGNPISGPLMSAMKIKDPETLRRQVFAGLLVAHAETLPLEFLEISLAAESIPGVDRSARSMLRAVTSLRGWRNQLLMRDTMARLPVPTLFLWGERDAFAPPSIGQDLAARMPSARLVTLPDTGHLPHLERPEAVAWHLTDQHGVDQICSEEMVPRAGIEPATP
jgi:pimeloyl-ACP methyl ester carboxylesterase